MKPATHNRHWYAAPLVVLAGLFAFYLGMFLHYRPYDIDNPWFLSFSYNTCVEHITRDQFLNIGFPQGMDGTQYFGRLAACIQAAALSPFGWQQFPAIVLSASFIVLGLAFWWLLLRRLGYTASTIASILLVAGFSEPFLSAANKARYEFFSFPIISLALLLVAFDLPFLGALLAGLAVETQPAAILGMLPVCFLAYSRTRNKTSMTIRLAVAFALALALHLLLHPEILTLHVMFARLGAQEKSIPGGFFRAYFLERPRHIPELLCFGAAAVVYWIRRRTQESHDLAICALLLALASVLMPHGNTAYMILVYPFLAAMALLAFRAERRPWIALGAVLLLLLPFQLYVTYLTRGLGYSTADIRQVAQRITHVAQQRGFDDRTLHVYGDYRIWFAHPHFFIASSVSTIEYARKSDLFVCYETPPQPLALEPRHQLYCGDLQRLTSLKLVDSFLLHQNRVDIYVRK